MLCLRQLFSRSVRKPQVQLIVPIQKQRIDKIKEFVLRSQRNTLSCVEIKPLIDELQQLNKRDASFGLYLIQNKLSSANSTFDVWFNGDWTTAGELIIDVVCERTDSFQVCFEWKNENGEHSITFKKHRALPNLNC